MVDTPIDHDVECHLIGEAERVLRAKVVCADCWKKFTGDVPEKITAVLAIRGTIPCVLCEVQIPARSKYYWMSDGEIKQAEKQMWDEEEALKEQEDLEALTEEMEQLCENIAIVMDTLLGVSCPRDVSPAWKALCKVTGRDGEPWLLESVSDDETDGVYRRLGLRAVAKLLKIKEECQNVLETEHGFSRPEQLARHIKDICEED